MAPSADGDDKLSLIGSVALGTGVMIGAGIFALVGQVAGLAGDWFPLAFLLGAIVAGAAPTPTSDTPASNPSSGGIAMLLKDAYGPGVIAGTFSLFMYVSMVVAESLLARTFGTYLLRPFGLQDSVVLVPVLGVVVIAAATIVNLIGNGWSRHPPPRRPSRRSWASPCSRSPESSARGCPRSSPTVRGGDQHIPDSVVRFSRRRRPCACSPTRASPRSPIRATTSATRSRTSPARS